MEIDDADFIARLRERLASTVALPADHASFVADPLSAWIEDAIGLTTDTPTDRLIRRKPRAIQWAGRCCRRVGVGRRRHARGGKLRGVMIRRGRLKDLAKFAALVQP